MRIDITSIEAVLINSSTNTENRCLIPFWKVGYEVHNINDSVQVCSLTGELIWKHEQIDTDEIVEFIRGIFK
jgi:hypothetical protein